jgi:hypothetical protein
MLQPVVRTAEWLMHRAAAEGADADAAAAARDADGGGSVHVPSALPPPPLRLLPPPGRRSRREELLAAEAPTDPTPLVRAIVPTRMKTNAHTCLQDGGGGGGGGDESSGGDVKGGGGGTRWNPGHAKLVGPHVDNGGNHHRSQRLVVDVGEDARLAAASHLNVRGGILKRAEANTTDTTTNSDIIHTATHTATHTSALTRGGPLARPRVGAGVSGRRGSSARSTNHTDEETEGEADEKKEERSPSRGGAAITRAPKTSVAASRSQWPSSIRGSVAWFDEVILGVNP